MNKAEWKEKEYPSYSEDCRIDAVIRSRGLRKQGYTTHVKIGLHGYVLLWRKREKK